MVHLEGERSGLKLIYIFHMVFRVSGRKGNWGVNLLALITRLNNSGQKTSNAWLVQTANLRDTFLPQNRTDYTNRCKFRLSVVFLHRLSVYISILLGVNSESFG